MRCWKCPAETGSQSSVLCHDCHAKEVAKVHDHDTETTQEVEPLGGKYIIPPSRATRPTSSGRRVIKNGRNS